MSQLQLGFSTGCLFKTHPRISKETFAVFRSLGCNAIELVCDSDEDISKLINEIVQADLRGFEYISLHAPVLITTKTLELIQQVHEIYNLKCVVLHPDEIENWEIFERFDLPLAFENMDWKKERGKYVDSMQAVFEKCDAKMVLDLNHCFTNDPSMILAKEMVDEFDSRIAEIHLSGFETMHELLYKTQQTEILDAIPKRELPIIIESGCETIEDAQKELAYVKQYLSK